MSHIKKFVLTALTMACLSAGCSSGPGGECGERAKHHNGFTPCRRGYCAPETSDGDEYDICLLYRKLGQSCQDGSQCRGKDGDVDAFCDEGLCRPTRAMGESCEPSEYGFDPPCQDLLWCAESGQCEPLRKLGEPCGRCEKGLRCDEEMCKQRSQDEGCDEVTYCDEPTHQCYVQPDGSRGVCAGRGTLHMGGG